MPVSRLTLGALLAALVLVGTSAPGGAAARAGTAGPCPSLGSGVTVVVDHGSLGGGTEVRCAAGEPASGLAALQGAGFSYGFVPGKPGFVCTIDGGPDPCNGAPASAYWSYHHAPRGGDWTYATIGAGTRRPPIGSVEGWAFGDGDEPAGAPPAAPAVVAPPPPPPPPPTPSPSPAPSPSPSPSPVPAPAGSPSPAPPVVPAPSTTQRSGTQSTGPDAAAPSTTESSGATGPSTSTTSAVRVGAAPSTTGEVASPAGLAIGDATETDDETGTLSPAVVLVVLAAVGALGVVLARRRSNDGDGPTT